MSAEQGIVAILERERKTIHIGVIAHLLHKEGYIEPYNLMWDIGSSMDVNWWKTIHQGIDCLIRSGKVGVIGSNHIFLTEVRG